MSTSELNRIQMESDDDLSSGSNTDSEAESAVTIETNTAESLYDVGELRRPNLSLMKDAIKHAIWRDSTRPGPGFRADGWLGWVSSCSCYIRICTHIQHYTVMACRVVLRRRISTDYTVEGIS
jgi:hypothetical protein